MDFKDKGSPHLGNGFTKGQLTFLEKAEKWLYTDELAFTLKGYAGTGKTFVLKYFLDKIVKTPSCVTAPTHKAVRVIEEATNRKGKTLQSLHGLRPNVNLESFSPDNIQFDSLGIVYISNYKLIVIDECSMVNTGLHQINLARAKYYNVKILYVGDPAQIPPINENISPSFLVENQFELTEIVRQDSDNPIIHLLNCLRTDIKNDGNSFFNYIKLNPSQVNTKGEGYKSVKMQEFHRTAFDIFKSDDFSKNPDYARITAWKNDTVLYHNNIIRNVLAHYYHNEKEIVYDPSFKVDVIDINDLLIGYKTIVDEFNKPMLINSEDYVVNGITKRKSDNGYSCFSVQLSQRSQALNNMTLNIVDHKDSSFILFYEMVKSLYYNAKYAKGIDRGKRWKEFYEFKDRNLCLTAFPILEGEEVKTTIPKDIDYGFALSAHKCQGSTVQNMFVNANDMLYYKNGNLVTNTKYSPNAISTRNRLLYTAISRASKFVTINI